MAARREARGDVGELESHLQSIYQSYQAIKNFQQDPPVSLSLTAASKKGKLFGTGLSALMLAAQADHLAVVAQLLAAGADVKAVDGRGFTALMHAACWGHNAGATVVEAFERRNRRQSICQQLTTNRDQIEVACEFFECCEVLGSDHWRRVTISS